MTKPKRPNSVVLVNNGGGKYGDYKVVTRSGRAVLGHVWQSMRSPGKWNGATPYRWVIEGAATRAEAVAAVVEHAKREVAEATP